MNIYLVLILCVIIVNLFVTPKRFRKIVNPTIFFSISWLVICFLAQMKLLNLYFANEETYFIIWVGVCFFSIGAGSSYIFKRYTFTCRGHYSEKKEYVLRYRLLEILAIISIIYFLPSFIRSLLIMLSGFSLNDVRGVIQESEASTGIANFLYNFFFLPIAVALEPLASIDFWCGKRNMRFILEVVVLVVVRTLGDGGRTPFFNLVLYFIIGYIIHRLWHNKKNKQIELKVEKKERRLFRRVSIVGGLGLLTLTIMRTANTIFRKVYFYFSMSPILLNTWKGIVDDLGYKGYGLVSFNGIFYGIEYFRKNLTGTNYIPNIYDAFKLIISTDSEWKKIAPTTTANAYVSCFWFFYADGGLIGVMIISLLYGFVLNLCFLKLYKNRSLKMATIYLLLFQGLFFSFIRFPFSKAYYCIAFIIIYMCIFKKVLKRDC